MSLISGLLAGAAAGTLDSWETRKAELKVEAANVFRRETDQIAVQNTIAKENRLKEANKEANKEAEEKWKNTPPEQRPAYLKLIAKVFERKITNPNDENGNPIDYSGVIAEIKKYHGVTSNRPTPTDPAYIKAEKERLEKERLAKEKLAKENVSINELIEQADANTNPNTNTNTEQNLDPKFKAAQDFVDSRTKDPGNRAIGVVGESLSEVGKTITGLIPNFSGLEFLPVNRALAIMNRGGLLSESQYKLIMDKMMEDNGMSKPVNVQMYKKAKKSLELLRMNNSGSANN